MRIVPAKVTVGAILVAAQIGSPVLAQETLPRVGPVVLPHTQVLSLTAFHIPAVYKLYVSLPSDYDMAQTYPVVYVLDADYSFAIARNVVEHLSDRQDLRDVLVVGIAYDGPPRYRLNRTRDYTPSHSPTGGYGPAYQRVSGGGPAFREFLESELIPFIDTTYSTTQERTLVGHSYGGLFATWVSITAPDLFTSFVVVSPSLWYDEEMIFGVEEAYAVKHDRLPARMAFYVGSNERNLAHDMVDELTRYVARLRTRQYDDLELEFFVFPDETHNSVFPAAMSKGLRYVLRGR